MDGNTVLEGTANVTVVAFSVGLDMKISYAAIVSANFYLISDRPTTIKCTMKKFLA